ncbi:hypothetical protein CFP56_038137 [Quercus suber]|uniref:Uncharacterized protein n=1 Tax=Quercus suber TaxID=58331 RepID=A0AAW0J338_QUESU
MSSAILSKKFSVPSMTNTLLNHGTWERNRDLKSEAKKEENIYLGPHGAPPSQSKQQEPNSIGHK